ncbi:hypothetical protein P0Y35_02665 [Kiritimatiellaeota bacterium B1221]|nr:hypothetical protein [Kiritimatiellaeota bacterium B1221]
MPAAILLLTIPSLAQANAGTPLMWAGLIHLVFGNLLIGIVEGLLLAKFFGLAKRKCICLLITANYLSAWLGGWVIGKAVAQMLPMGLYTAWPLFWVMVVFTYLLTLLLEFPFVAYAFKGDPVWRRKSIRASLWVQSISYLALFGWYWSACGTSLYTRTRVVALSSISLPEKVQIYFISVDDGDVYTGSLRASEWTKVYDLNSSRRNDRLYVKPSDALPDSWDLMARMETDLHRSPAFVMVEEDVALVAAPALRSITTDPPQYDGSWFNFGPVPKLGDADSSLWSFRTGFWPVEGLRGTRVGSDERVWFSLETPFLAWSVRNATHLPSDKVLLQLGDDQLCIYDPETKRIALLTEGRGPIAVIEKAAAVMERGEVSKF